MRNLSAEEEQDKLHSSETKHSGYGILNPPPATTIQRPPIYANSQQSNNPASTQPPQYGQRRQPFYGTPGSAVPYYRTHSAQYDLLSDRTVGSPRTKLNQTPMQRPHSGLGPPQGTPTGPPGSAGMHTAPGPIPATAPLVVRQDQNGVRWVAFEYSRDRVKMEYNIRCDVESVTVDELPQEFKTENCVYPRACCHKDQYRGNRLHYDTECNAVGWALAQLNPCLRGKRGLIQRAVDSWRNSNQDPRLRSRRVRRMAKIKNTETDVEVSDVPNTAGITTSQDAEPTSMSTEDPLFTLYKFLGYRESNQGKRSMPADKRDQSLRLYGNGDITSESSQARLRGGIDAGRTELHGDHGSLEERWHQRNRHVPDAEDSPSERESNDTEFSQPSSDISHSVKFDILRSALSPTKRKIVDRVMETFLETFRSEPNSSGDEESDVDSSTLGESDSDSEGSLADRTEKTRGSDAANKNTGGKCGQDREEQQSNQSDACSKTSSNQKDEQCARGSSKSSNGNYGRRKRLRTASTDDSESRSLTRRLACPFFKKFSPRPPKAASCYFPGFGSVSRVK
ncbi:hypothetical protein SLS56_008647 [Neofusicoccum ribis]|uniref:DUF8032 domain-containing protein n=1 Tax=Neofusicoccum ribis TaxID=45134 RepID=A0ABR3SJK5_9PEZI